MSWTDADVVSESSWSDEDIVQDPPTLAPAPSVGKALKRQLGLSLRAGANIAASPFVIGGNVLNRTINALGGNMNPNLQEVVDRGLTAAGMPEPETGVEKFGQTMAQSAPAVAIPAGVVPQVLGNAAVSAATAPAGEELESAIAGGAVGGAGQMLSRTLGGMIKPTKEAARLMAKGVKLTPGQMQGGVLNKVEEFLSETPIVGTPLRQRMGEARTGWEKSVLNDVLPPKAAPVDTISGMQDAFDQAYGDSLKLAKFRAGSQPTIPTSKLAIDAKQAVPEATMEQVQKAHRLVEDLMENNGMPHTPESLQAAESAIKKNVSRFKFSQNPEDQIYGQLLDEMAGNMRNQWRGSLSNTKQAELALIDSQYRKFLPVQNAAKKGDVSLVGEELPGEFSPKALLRELRAGDRSGSKGQWFAGERPLQETATGAEKIIGSGTPSSSSLSHMLRGAAAVGSATGMGAVPTAGILAGAYGYGTRPVQKVLTGKFATGGYDKQKILADVLRKLSPSVAGTFNKE